MDFITKITKTLSGRVSGFFGAKRAPPTTKSVGELTGCHPNWGQASQMADPDKDRAEYVEKG